MRSTVTRLAAVIVFAAVVGLYTLLHTSEGIAVADIRDALSHAKWMHVTTDKASGECWFNFEDDVLSVMNQDGRIEYHDFANGRQFTYDPAIDTLYISTMTKESSTEGLRLGGPFGIIDEFTTRFGREEGQEFINRTEKFQGHDTLVWEFSSGTSDSLSETVRVFVDVDEYLPLAAEIIHIRDGEVQRTHVYFDYPRQGPNDIYSMGVPEDAKRVFLAPPGHDLLALALEHDAHRDQTGSFRGMTIFTHEGVNSITVFEYEQRKNRLRCSVSGGVANFESKTVDELASSLMAGGWLHLLDWEHSTAFPVCFPVAVLPNEIPFSGSLEKDIAHRGGGWEKAFSDDPNLVNCVGYELTGYPRGTGKTSTTWWIDLEHDYWVRRFTYELLETAAKVPSDMVTEQRCDVVDFAETSEGWLYPCQIAKTRADGNGRRIETYRIYLESLKEADMNRAFLVRALSSLVTRE